MPNIQEMLEGTSFILPKTSERWPKRIAIGIDKKIGIIRDIITYSAISLGGDEAYSMALRFIKKGIRKTKKADRISNIECRCSCKAYKFYYANANYQRKAYFGFPTKWVKVKSKIKNVSVIPGFCKHLVSLAFALAKNKEFDIETEKSIKL